MYKLKPEPDTPMDLACRAMGVFVGGYALGASTHLFIDATLQGHKAVLFPLLGSLVPGTLLDDNLWLGGSSLISLYVAFREFEYILGADSPIIQAVAPLVERGKKVADEVDYWLKRIVELLSRMIAAMGAGLKVMFDTRPEARGLTA